MNSKALNVSTILTMTLITIMAIASEISEEFKNLLTKLAGHHWTSKSLTALIFFIFAYLLLTRFLDDKLNNKDLYYTSVSAITYIFIIFLFFVFTYLGRI